MRGASHARDYITDAPTAAREKKRCGSGCPLDIRGPVTAANYLASVREMWPSKGGAPSAPASRNCSPSAISSR